MRILFAVQHAYPLPHAMPAFAAARKLHAPAGAVAQLDADVRAALADGDYRAHDALGVPHEV